MEPLEPLDRMLRDPSAASPPERLRALLGDHRLVAASIVLGVVATLAVVAAASPSPPQLTLPPATSSHPSPDPAAPADDAGSATAVGTAVATTAAPELVVHVAGSVATPGLVRVDAGGRVADVLDAAGGAIGAADVDRLNLAAPVVDGSRIYVPAVGEVEPPVVVAGSGAPSSPTSPGTDGGSPTSSGPIDLNTATAEQLDSLPGVGPATAAAILTHRDEHGPFLGVDELQDVRGIGPAKFEALRDLVTAGG